MAKGKEQKNTKKKKFVEAPKSNNLGREENAQTQKDGLLYLFVALARRASEGGKRLKSIKYLPDFFFKSETAKQKKKDEQNLKKDATKKKK